MKDFYSKIYECAHGYVYTPIFLALKPVLESIKNGPPKTFEEICDEFEANEGPFEIVLSYLIGMKILKIEKGKLVACENIEDILHIPDELASLYKFSPLEYIRSSPEKNKEKFQPFFPELIDQWPSVKAQEIKNFLDGVVFLPLLLALYQENKGQIKNREISLEHVHPLIKEEVGFVFNYFNLGLLKGDFLELNEVGEWIYKNVLNHSLSVSYRPLLAEIQTLLFGDAKSIFENSEGFEKHVDRSLNVLSSGSMHKGYFRETLNQILAIFDSSPIEEQPAYIVDTGCGDGTFLQEVYLEIKNNTLRGRNLSKYPLLMIGVDYNKAAINETSKRLKRLEIPFLAIFGDIGDPKGILESLKKHGIDHLKRFLHIRSFLDHDRPYIPPSKVISTPFEIAAGAFSDRSGKKISYNEVVCSLTDHLKRWSDILKEKDDLMILEVHNLDPKKAYETRSSSMSLYFDLLQALSGQFLVSANAFLYCAYQSGLTTKKFIKFSQTESYTRITFNHFVKMEFKAHYVKENSNGSLEGFSDEKLSQVSSWLNESCNCIFYLTSRAKDSISRPVVIFFVKEHKKCPQSLNLTFREAVGEKFCVCIEKIECFLPEKKHVIEVLGKYVYNFFSINSCYEYLFFKFESGRCSSLTEDSFKKLVNENNDEIVRVNELTPTLFESEHAEEQFSYYGYNLFENRADDKKTDEENQEKSAVTPDYVRNKLIEEIANLPSQETRTLFRENDSILNLGLDSLEMGKLARKLSRDFNIKLSITTLFKQPTFKDIINNIISEKIDKTHSLTVQTTLNNKSECYCIGLPQEPMWFWYQLIGETSAYNVPRIEHFTGDFSHDCFVQSLKTVMQRHEILRTRYEVKDHFPHFWVLSESEFEVPVYEHSFCEGEATIENINSVIEREINRPFDLTAESPLRVLIIKVSDDEFVLVITMHHIVTDGSSIPIFWHELVTIYNAYLINEKPDLANLTKQYTDWCQEHRKAFELGEKEYEFLYWEKTLGNSPPVLELPTDFGYRDEQTFNGNRVRFEFDESVTHELIEICREESVSLFMVLTALWGLFLLRHTKQKEIVIATPWANRDCEEIQNLIGCFVNTLPLYIQVSPEATLKEVFQQVKQLSLEAFEHASTPFHKIVERLKISNSSGRLPVYQTMIALEEENGWIKGDIFQGVKRKEPQATSFVSRDTSKFEISLSVRTKKSHMGTTISGEFVYNTDLFSNSTALKMKERFCYLVENVKKSINCKALECSILPLNERKEIFSLNPSKNYIPNELTVFTLFEKCATENQDSIALFFEEEKYTYGQLWKWVNNFASFLLEQGVHEKDSVAICMERGIELVIALLSVNQINATFVPIGTSLPEDRKRFILEDAGVQFLIVSSIEKESRDISEICLNREVLLNLDENPCNLRPSSQTMAYLIYTSGTTGKPKGVKISHANLVNDIVHIIQKQIPSHDFSLVLFSTNIIFDQFVEELYSPLCSGGSLLIVETILDLGWRAKPVTLLVTTPSQMELVLKYPVPATVASLVLGGEVLQEALINKIFEQTQINVIYNSYGPSECTDQVSVCKISRGERKPLSIGTPISNCEVYLLENRCALVPIGVWGEMYIGGAPVGEGYHNQEELNKASFFPNPFGDGKLYKTGDIARWNLSKELEFKGRKDNQIKIHGVRIEKEEIENFLSSQHSVESAYVHFHKTSEGSFEVFAYVTPKELDKSKLLDACTKFLPQQMVPKWIIPLDVFPLSCSGKININQLPLPIEREQKQPELKKQSSLPSPYALELCQLFKEILDAPSIAQDESFFRVGGNSLLAVQLIALIKQKYDIRLKMRDLLIHSTPNEIGLLIQKEKTDTEKGDSHPISKETVLKMQVEMSDDIPLGGNKVVIIGAGVAGIMAAIECKNRKIDFTIIEQAPDFGGIWLHGCNESSRLQTTSKVYTVHPKFEHSSLYPDKREVLAYLGEIAEGFQLKDHTLFDTEVIDVNKNNKSLHVQTKNRKTDERQIIECDGLLVCTGKHHIPYVPNWPIENGSPRIVHASCLDEMELEEQNVLIVGGGSFAVEALRIAHQKGAKNVLMLPRTSHWILPTLADTILYSGIKDDLTFEENYNQHIKNLNEWLSLYYKQFNLEHVIPLEEHQVFDAFISTSDEFFQLTQNENVSVQIGEIESLKKEGVKLKDGSTLSADVVIAATGYQDPDLSFLKSMYLNESPQVYKGYMLANDPRVGFVGFLDMVVSAPAVIPLNLELALGAMTSYEYRPSISRVSVWLDQMPQDLLSNIKSHLSWLVEERSFLVESAQNNSPFESIFSIENKSKPAVIQGSCEITYEKLQAVAHHISSYLKKLNHKRLILIVPNTAEGLAVLLGSIQCEIQLILIPSDASRDFVSKVINEEEKIDAIFVLEKDSSRLFSQDQIVNLNLVFFDSIFTESSLSGQEEISFTSNRAEKKWTQPQSFSCIFWTSGSTGDPKGVMHDFLSLVSSIENFSIHYVRHEAESPRLLFNNSLAHLGGVMAAFAVLFNQGTLIFRDHDSTLNLEVIKKYRPSILIEMASNFFDMLVHKRSIADDALGSVKRVILGGEPTFNEQIRLIAQTKIPSVIFTFGISETGPLFRYFPSTDSFCFLGEPLENVDYKIVQKNGKEVCGVGSGELMVKCPSLFKGYYKNKELTKESVDNDGFFKTGDFLFRSDDGNLRYRGRTNDQIDNNLYLFEIENLIAEHLAVDNVQVVFMGKNGDVILVRVYLHLEGGIDDQINKKLAEFLHENYPIYLFECQVISTLPLVKSSSKKTNRHALKEYASVQQPKVLLFPGQGSQYLGMNNKSLRFEKVQQLYTKANEILGYDVLSLSNNPTLLDKTEFSQVAIYLASIAELICYQEVNPNFLDECQCTLGLSLGEFTALTAAGAISIEDGIRLLSIRGKAMQKVSNPLEQSMVSVVELSIEEVQELLETYDHVVISTYIGPQHCVISGASESCSRIIEAVEKKGGITSKLNVAGAFHSYFMSPAIPEVSDAIENIKWSEPQFPVISNFDGLPSTDILVLKEKLIQQLDHSVYFYTALESIDNMGIDFNEIAEIGPGKTLTNIARKYFHNKIKTEV